MCMCARTYVYVFNFKGTHKLVVLGSGGGMSDQIQQHCAVQNS